MRKVYFPPWCRVGPFAIGLVLGYILFATRGKVTMSKVSASNEYKGTFQGIRGQGFVLVAKVVSVQKMKINISSSSSSLFFSLFFFFYSHSKFVSLLVTRGQFRMSQSVLCPCLSPGIALGCQMSVSLLSLGVNSRCQWSVSVFATRRTFKMSKVSCVSLFVTRRRFRMSKVSYVSLFVSRKIFWMPRVSIPVCH